MSEVCLQVKRNGNIVTNPDEGSNGSSSAPDGDLDAAYALLLAGRKWGQQKYKQRGIQVRQFSQQQYRSAAYIAATAPQSVQVWQLVWASACNAMEPIMLSVCMCFATPQACYFCTSS